MVGADEPQITLPLSIGGLPPKGERKMVHLRQGSIHCKQTCPCGGGGGSGGGEWWGRRYQPPGFNFPAPYRDMTPGRESCI